MFAFAQHDILINEAQNLRQFVCFLGKIIFRGSFSKKLSMSKSTKSRDEK